MIYGSIRKITNSSGITPIAVATTSVVYSQAFKLGYGQYFGIWQKAASSGTIDLKIQLEQSTNPPAAEGSADANWVIGDGVADINSSLSSTTTQIKVISPVPMLWARLKITGGASNDASTTLDCRLFSQEMAGL